MLIPEYLQIKPNIGLWRIKYTKNFIRLKSVILQKSRTNGNCMRVVVSQQTNETREGMKDRNLVRDPRKTSSF